MYTHTLTYICSLFTYKYVYSYIYIFALKLMTEPKETLGGEARSLCKHSPEKSRAVGGIRMMTVRVRARKTYDANTRQKKIFFS